jgi:excisionase family DNA binding protein
MASQTHTDAELRHEPWRTVADVAAHLGCSEDFLRARLRLGLPHLRLGSDYRLRVSEVESFLRPAQRRRGCGGGGR